MSVAVLLTVVAAAGASHQEHVVPVEGALGLASAASVRHSHRGYPAAVLMPACVYRMGCWPLHKWRLTMQLAPLVCVVQSQQQCSFGSDGSVAVAVCVRASVHAAIPHAGRAACTVVQWICQRLQDG